MKRENKVCSLSRAKKLAELGVVQESELMWNIRGEQVWLSVDYMSPYFPLSGKGEVKSYAAFNSDELGVMLFGGSVGDYTSIASDIAHTAIADSIHRGIPFIEANARADKLIKRIVEDFDSVKELNRRLSGEKVSFSAFKKSLKSKAKTRGMKMIIIDPNTCPGCGVSIKKDVDASKKMGEK